MEKQISILYRSPIFMASMFALLTINGIVLVFMLNNTLGEPMAKMETHMGTIAVSMTAVNQHMGSVASDIRGVRDDMKKLNKVLGVMNNKMEVMFNDSMLPMAKAVQGIDRNMATMTTNVHHIRYTMHEFQRQLPVMTQAAGQMGRMMQPMNMIRSFMPF